MGDSIDRTRLPGYNVNDLSDSSHAGINTAIMAEKLVWQAICYTLSIC